MQHWILKISFQSNFGSPVKEQLEEGINVLDGGCGPGTWSLEMAKDYPQSKFTGIDISEAFPTEIKPSNCNFQVHNVNDPLPFSQNHFDYIFQRLLVVGIKEDDWDNVISQYMHVLKPGGWLELLEALLPECVNPGPKLELLMNTLAEMIETKGVNPRIAHSIKDRMKKAGIEKINVKYVRIPVHHGGKIGELFWQDFVMGIRDVVRPVIIKKIPELEDPDAYTNFIEECGKECDELKTYIKFYRFYGQKPTTIIA
ncbi:S-adenosyl-L-methionine-dependent methyltransferase [Circinella umbellata]|nr:S-adenosyl-L-methionine-dependent methyltransferase [Circinella umbellata]